MSSRRPTFESLQRCARVLSTLGWLALSPCACSNGAAPNEAGTEVNSEHSYLTPRYLGEAIDQLVTPLPKPVRVLSLTALNRVVVLQARDAKDPRTVLEYRYSDGRISGPVPVELKGPGKLSDNLFRIDSVDPHIAERVLTSVRAEYSEEIRKLVLTRNLPSSMDIQFRVFLKTATGDRVVAADKGGHLLGPLTPAASPTTFASPPPP